MKFPIGIQSFSTLIKGDFYYADKTDLVYALTKEAKYVFLQRPRHFGKSLLLSTLLGYYKGREELFRGLKLEALKGDEPWNAFPTIRIEFEEGHARNMGDYESIDGFYALVDRNLGWLEERYGFDPDVTSPAGRFRDLIGRMHEAEGRKVAVFIDDYDYAFKATIKNPDLHRKVLAELRDFFSVLKEAAEDIEFCFITGADRLSSPGLFEQLKEELRDISFDERYEAVCGLTDADLDAYFQEPIEHFASRQHVPAMLLRMELARNFGGYRFSTAMTDIYRPIHLMHSLMTQDLRCNPANVQTPGFIGRQLSRRGMALSELESVRVAGCDLRGLDAFGRFDLMTQLYLLGNLTIKDYDKETDIYTLGYPNEETTQAMIFSFLPAFADINPKDGPVMMSHIRQGMKLMDPERYVNVVCDFFENYERLFVHPGKMQQHFENIVYLICRMLSSRYQAEYAVSYDRIDLLVKKSTANFLFEFKLNLPMAERGLTKRRADLLSPLLKDKRQLIRIFINFDPLSHKVDGWEMLDKEAPFMEE